MRIHRQHTASPVTKCGKGCRFITAIIAAFTLCSTSAVSENRFAIMASNYDQQTAETIAVSFANIFENLKAGEQFVGLSPSGEVLWDASLPNEPIYNSHRVLRQQALNPAWQNAMLFFAKAINASGSSQVHLPASLHDLLRYRVSARDQVVFYGNPLWDGKPNHEDFALTGAYPTDTHFAMNRAETPFGTAADQPLTGVTVHFCDTVNADYESTLHQEGVQRTYTLLVDAAGGTFATITSDVTRCSQRVAQADSTNAPVYEADASETRFGMISGTVQIVQSTPIAPANASAQLRADIQSGIVKMVRLTLYDNGSIDGDVVEVSSSGFSRTVPLTRDGTTFEVPLVHGAMVLTGIEDGGGGITVSVALPNGDHIVDGSMSVGEQINLQIPIQ